MGNLLFDILKIGNGYVVTLDTEKWFFATIEEVSEYIKEQLHVEEQA